VHSCHVLPPAPSTHDTHSSLGPWLSGSRFDFRNAALDPYTRLLGFNLGHVAGLMPE